MLGWLLLVALGMSCGVLATLLATRNSRSIGPDLRHELDVELERARRYERPFQLARISGPGMDRVDVGRRGTDVRRTDLSWHWGGDLFVLLTESDVSAGLGWLQRVVHEAGDGELEVRTACFPHDGLTLAALLDHLTESDALILPGSAPAPSFGTRTQVAS